ncbi:hypothetical protein LSAT2_028537, partial [Lamellibrachia satsuma]
AFVAFIELLREFADQFTDLRAHSGEWKKPDSDAADRWTPGWVLTIAATSLQTDVGTLVAQQQSSHTLVNMAPVVLEDEDVEIPNSFYVKSKQKVVHLLASSLEKKVEWQEVVCANCSRLKVALPYDDNRMNRVCDKCYNVLSQGGSARTKLTCGFLHISTDTKHWQKQYFVIQNDFVLYAFKDAETSIPLSGYTVVMTTEADLMTRDNVLKLFCVAQNKTFYFQAEDRLDLRRWVIDMDIAIQGKVTRHSDTWYSSKREESTC